ncbi:MAG: HEAT repeat domain-containing protein [Planctomycetota bacterium]|jgi:HEAT repeat protein
MRKCLLLLVSVLLLPGAARAGEASAVERLKADNAEVELAACRELIAGGEKYVKEIEAAYKALPEDQRKFRERYRDAVARIRTEQVKSWALKSAPGLKDSFPWDGLIRYLTWTSRLATPTDARRAFCLITRSAEGWDEKEATGILAECLKHESAAVRLAAVQALDREEWKAGAVDLLAGALKDADELVRVEAGGYLVARADQRGLAAVLAGALSENEKVRDACQPTVDSLILTDEKGQRPRFKHSEEEVDVLVSLLALKPWNTRGTVIRLLGMVGDRRASARLLKQLPLEDNPKNRRRIFTSLAQLRCRAAAAEVPKYFGGKLSASKKNYNWPVAADWAELGDPDQVPKMIELLGSEDRLIPLYAAFALGWAFGGPEQMGEVPLRGRPDVVLVPAPGGGFEKKPFAEAPAAAELKAKWKAFWATNKSKYSWSDEKSGLRPAPKPE